MNANDFCNMWKREAALTPLTVSEIVYCFKMSQWEATQIMTTLVKNGEATKELKGNTYTYTLVNADMPARCPECNAKLSHGLCLVCDMMEL